MFSPRIIELARVEATNSIIKSSPFDGNNRPLFPASFSLQRHSIAQVAQANAHLESLMTEDEKGKHILTRPYTTDEVRWIRNERNMCRCDFVYWATRYGFIINWEGELVRFNPNIAQRMALDLFAELEEMEIAILIQFLKARQLGVTTITELIILWKTIFYPRTNALVASSDPDKSSQMADKMVICFNNQPGWLVPEVTAQRTGELIEFKKQNSAISIQHGTQMSGLARGATPTTFHLSEVCDYRNPEALIDAALLRAVHDSPRVFGVLESTAAGRYNYWHNKWLFNIENWPTHTSRLCPGFLPWYVGTDIYPTDTWLKAHPIPIGWEPENIVLAHAERAKNYVRTGQNKLVTKFLGANWEMPRKQMWFWWVTRKEYAALKKLGDFYAELCADDIEAFQANKKSVFDAEVLSEFRENARFPYGVYGIQADQTEIPPSLQANPRDIDPNTPPIDIHCKWAPTQPAHDYRLVPLLHRGSGVFDPNGRILMYEPPRPGFTYGIGTDTGYGQGQDRSVIQILRKGDAERNDAQVLEFASDAVNSFNLWPINLALGTLYSTSIGGQIRQAKQVIEMAANGENVHNELKKRGWRNFHRWVRYDRKMMNQEASATREGWYTTSWSRPMVIDMLLDALNSGWLDINSPWFINEMGDLQLDYEKQKIEAVAGAHDDRIMSMGIVLFSLHALETRHADKWKERTQRDLATPVVFAKFSPGEQGMGPATDSPLDSYTYRVVNPYDNEDLRGPGSMIWTPRDEER